jgi:hypothetical protein
MRYTVLRDRDENGRDTAETECCRICFHTFFAETETDKNNLKNKYGNRYKANTT